MSMPLPLPSVRERKNYHWFVVATVCIGAFMAALDSSIVNIALPVMKHVFHTRMSTIEWVSLTYILTLAALIVPFSRLSDMWGRRWMYTIGFSVFIVGSFFCGLAPSLVVLFLARVLQAAGAAMLQANSVSIITAATPARDRGKAIGIQASAQGVGLTLGPLVGGLLITLVGWRWIFYVNVPVGIIGTLLGAMLLPADAKKTQREVFDWLGAVFLAPALVALMYVLNAGAASGFGSLTMIVCYVVLVGGFAGFVVIERRVAFPIIDFNLLRDKTFLSGNITVVLSFAVMYAVMFLAPFYLDDVHHFSSLSAGAFLTAIPIGMAVFTPISGMMTDRFQARMPTIIGMTASTVGAVALALFTAHYVTLWFVIGLLGVGIGMGMFTPANNSTVMGSLPSNRFSVGGGILNMSRTLGMGLGVTFGGLTYQLLLQARGAISETKATIAQIVPSFQDSFFIVAVIALAVTCIVALGNRKTA